jgi:uncharacterized protein (TIGR03083 family)
MLMSTGTDVWTDVHQERQALLEILETLTPEQWDAPSLCTEWRVRDVVGHMVSETRMTIAQAAWGFITSGFRINRYIAKDARHRGAAPSRTFSRTSEAWCSLAHICPACRRCPCSRT